MALLRFPPFLTYITSVATFRYLQETIFLVISIPCILIVGYLGFKKENIFVEIPPPYALPQGNVCLEGFSFS